MRCFTLTIGDLDAEPGIRLSRGEQGLPVLRIGHDKGVSISLPESAAMRAADLDQAASFFPECRDMPCAALLYADLDNEGVLIPCEPREEDRRILLHLKAPGPGDEQIRYMGTNKVERFDDEANKVRTNYPHLENVVGIELVAESRGDVLIVMHPGATFRAVRPRGSHPRHHSYMLAPARKPFVIKILRKSDHRPAHGERAA